MQISYAMYYQKKYAKGIKQSLFPDRFSAELVDDVSPYSRKSQRIHLSPLYQDIVQHISHWPYTSAHQVADTGYRSQGETHLPISANISSAIRKKIQTRWRGDFQGF